MSDPNAAPKIEKAPKADGPKKEKLDRLVLRLQDPQKNSLRFTAKAKKDGSAVSFVIHTVRQEDGRAKSSRGATEQHSDFGAAKAAAEAGSAKAAKMGWTARAKRTRTTKDTFDLSSLPSPEKEAPAPAKK